MNNNAPLRLDMPFGEALQRLLQTNPDEVRASMKAWRKARDEAVAKSPNVTSLKRARERKRNGK